jgi:hypothetical protein
MGGKLNGKVETDMPKRCPHCDGTDTIIQKWSDYDYSDAVMNDEGDGWIVPPIPQTVTVLVCLECGAKT